MTNSNIQAKKALHKVTRYKIEAFSIFTSDKQRKNIDTLYYNIAGLKPPTTEQLNRTKHKYPCMSAVMKKKSSSEYTEGKKIFVSHKKSVALFRTYKIVGTDYIKTEVTICGHPRHKKKNIKKAYELLDVATKGIEKSLLPYYIQNGDEFFPLDNFLKK